VAIENNSLYYAPIHSRKNGKWEFVHQDILSAGEGDMKHIWPEYGQKALLKFISIGFYLRVRQNVDYLSTAIKLAHWYLAD
jgi:hypothetical protein